MKTNESILRCLLPWTALVLIACGGGQAASSPQTTSARPSCDAIDEACDPYENAPGIGKECHELGEAKSTDEAVCAKRKAECLAACPPKK